MGFCLLFFFLGWWERNKGSGGEPLARQVKAAQGAGRYGAASRGWGGGSPKSRRLFGCAPLNPHPPPCFYAGDFSFSLTPPIFLQRGGIAPPAAPPGPAAGGIADLFPFLRRSLLPGSPARQRQDGSIFHCPLPTLSAPAPRSQPRRGAPGLPLRSPR